MGSNLQLLATGTDAKTVKGEKFGWKTFIMYLAPFNLSGRNVCPFASAGCAAACLNTAGRGAMKNVQDARLRKTKWFFEDRAGFLDALRSDIGTAVRMAKAANMKPCFRLNGTSDINWGPLIVKDFPDLQFYDYSADPARVVENELPNYHLTLSRKEDNQDAVLQTLGRGYNASVVFSSPAFPGTWHGFSVVDGDVSDLRFLDPKGVVVGLKAKGKAGQDTSGFVVPV